MKRFLLRTVLFIIPIILCFILISSYQFVDNKYQTTVRGKEIYLSIRKSKQKSKAKKLVIGDSTGNQLFPNTEKNDTINSLACNQAIGMVGQYLLLKNYFEAGNKVDTVFMIFSPFSFQNNLNQGFTFHYFLKPFLKDEYKPYFSATVMNQIKKIPYSNLVRIPIILTSNWAPGFVCKDSINYTFLSPVSIEYLQRIKVLCRKNASKLILLPSPLSLRKKKLIDSINRNEILKNGFTDEFKTYFEKIIYLDERYFADGIHLIDPHTYTVVYKKEWVK